MKFVKHALAAALFASAGFSHAGVGPYNTGVDNAGVVLADNTIDTHYSISGGSTFAATSAGGYPIGPWLGDNGSSAWIAPTTNTYGGYAYTYTTTFDLTGINLSTALLKGRLATDDQLTGLRINGTAVTLPASTTGYSYWTDFAVATGFISGVNSLSFDVLNSGGGPTGLRVEFTGNQLTPVPEPESYALALAGLMTVGVLARRRRA